MYGIPRKIGRYEIKNELGRGNMGAVYLARDPYIDREIAIKISNHRNTGSEENPDRFSREFFNEAKTVSRLIHPNIIAVYDANVHQGNCYIAIEYVDGSDMKAFCRGDALLPTEQVLEYMFGVCRGLDYAHNMGIIHRDIKPANIMLTSEGVVKIGDFGIACVQEETTSKTKVVGTPHYMSAEQVEQKPMDGRSDVFALGCVLYELLTGEKAFPGETPAQIVGRILDGETPSLSQRRPDLPGALDAIIVKALAKHPDDRYQTCLDLAYDLRVVQQQISDMKPEDSLTNILDYICNIPFFRDFSRDQVQKLLGASTALRVKKGDVIIEEGDTDDALYVILSGTVSISKQQERIVRIERGECFGEMAYLSHRPRTATVTAATDCILLKISSAVLDRFPDSMQLLFIKSCAMTLANRLAYTNEIVFTLLDKIQD